MASLFRKSALDKYSSQRQLDQEVVITQPSVGIALAGGIILIAGVLLWGIFGRISVSVEAEGIYLEQGKIEEEAVACYITLEDGKKVAPGMKVMIYPDTVNRQECGHMTGTVTRVDSYVTSREQAKERLGEDTLVEYFFAQGPVVEVLCRLQEDPDTKSGYHWSARKGAELTLKEGTPVSVRIITERKAPITILIPGLEKSLSGE